MIPGTDDLFVTKSFVEFVDLTSRVKNLLLSGVKRVALRADIDSHVELLVCNVARNKYSIPAVPSSDGQG